MNLDNIDPQEAERIFEHATKEIPDCFDSLDQFPSIYKHLYDSCRKNILLSLDNIRLVVKYLMFEVECSRRDNEKSQKTIIELQELVTHLMEENAGWQMLEPPPLPDGYDESQDYDDYEDPEDTEGDEWKF